MKDGLIVGVALGMIAGALLVNKCPQAKQLLEDSEKQVKKEINKLKKPVEKKQ